MLLLFGVILFYFILNFLFLLGISSVWWFSLRLRTWVPVRMSRLSEEFSLCFISDTTLRRWPALSVPVHQTANTTAGVQVEHTEVKKHYNTLNGYCDHHKSIPPHTHGLKKRVCRACVCDTALLWQKFYLTCVSVYECVLCVLILFSTGVEVSLAKRSPLLLLSSLVLCVQGKVD